MDIILVKDVEKLGYKHELVTVKNGFGRNYLIPQGFAIIANKENKAKLDKIIAEEDAKTAARLEEFKELAQKLKGITLQIKAKAGTTGKIFGSVSSVQIANALLEQAEIEIERRKISIPDEIKTLGTYTSVLDLHPEVDCKVDFEVIEG
jgi:large subunit ribosomal protein L9